MTPAVPSVRKLLVPAVKAAEGRYGRPFLEAIDWALQMDPAQRPQSVDAWRQRLLADHVAKGRHCTVACIAVPVN